MAAAPARLHRQLRGLRHALAGQSIGVWEIMVVHVAHAGRQLDVDLAYTTGPSNLPTPRLDRQDWHISVGTAGGAALIGWQLGHHQAGQGEHLAARRQRWPAGARGARPAHQCAPWLPQRRGTGHLHQQHGVSGSVWLQACVQQPSEKSASKFAVSCTYAADQTRPGSQPAR